MFSNNINIMLYVNDVEKEMEFWKSIGWFISSKTEIEGYQSFDMRAYDQSTTCFTVYDIEFIKKFSPEVADMVPSILFESNEIDKVWNVVKGKSDFCSEINEIPFKHFNFKTPNGMYFAVKEV